MKNDNNNTQKLASHLKEIGYGGLFQSGEDSVLDSIWQEGKNRKALLQIVEQSEYEDYVRLVASEILFAKSNKFPPKKLYNDIGFIYSQTLKMSGRNELPIISGNQWGFMYFTDKGEKNDYGPFGSHLMLSGKKAVPFLIELLDDDNMIYYEGSKEATVGNSLKYRVKDAAAYYISKIMGFPIQYIENKADRDQEIEALKEKLG